MIDHAIAKISALAIATGAAVATVSGISDDHVGFTQLAMGAAAALVAGTWGVLVAFDARMDNKIKASERRTIAQIHHLRDLLVEKGVIHNGRHLEEEDTKP